MNTTLSTATRAAAACLALGAVLTTAAPARAGGTLDVDFNLATHVGQETVLYGVAGRAGWRFDVGPVWIQPEAGGEYMVVPCCLADLGTQIRDRPRRRRRAARGDGPDRRRRRAELLRPRGLRLARPRLERPGVRRRRRAGRAARAVLPVRRAGRVQRRERPAVLPVRGDVAVHRAVGQLRRPRGGELLRRRSAPQP